jgi:hypothetical protein
MNASRSMAAWSGVLRNSPLCFQDMPNQNPAILLVYCSVLSLRREARILAVAGFSPDATLKERGQEARLRRQSKRRSKSQIATRKWERSPIFARNDMVAEQLPFGKYLSENYGCGVLCAAQHTTQNLIFG